MKSNEQIFTNTFKGSTNTFKRRLLSERIHYRAPFCYVIMTARITGRISRDCIEAALAKAFARHPLLGARIELDQDGGAWFEPADFCELPLEVLEKEGDLHWVQKAEEEYKKPFALHKGPLVRFILLDSPDASDLMVVCHHTICDGISLVYLIRDIMQFIENPSLEATALPVPPVLDFDNLQGSPKPGLLPELLLGHYNRKWEKSRKVFNETEYQMMYRNFWNREKLNIITHSMDEECLNFLHLRCRSEGVTINSAVSTAFIISQNLVQKNVHSFTKTGIAVNLRGRMTDAPGEGMGLFAGGNSIHTEYSEGKPFWTLAREFDSRVKKLLASKRKLYDMLLMNKLDQSLVDAVFFHLFGGFEDKTAAAFAKLLHFDRKNPGLGVTNLGKAGIPETYSQYELQTLFFVPPNIPGGEKILGVVTAGGRLNLSLACLQSALDEGTLKVVMEYAINLMRDNCDKCNSSNVLAEPYKTGTLFR